MDRCLSQLQPGDRWSGVVLTHSDGSIAMAHQQQVTVVGVAHSLDAKMMLYNWQLSSAAVPPTLSADECSRYVVFPGDGELTFAYAKEVCAGMGGITKGLNHLNIKTVATMDFNQMAVATQLLNGQPHALLGDIENLEHRYQLHTTPKPLRCLLAAGFPCQPLSTQGDKQGSADSRSGAFYATLQTAWEQQMAGLLLECVPGALTAAYIQEGLQKLCWSMGWDLCQQVLNLHRAWPCRRTRWWALLVPKPYNLAFIPDLPVLQELHNVAAIFPTWPKWPLEDEGLLMLTTREIDMYDDPVYGADDRHLVMNAPCPCILHSYGTVLQGCPCGCRRTQFTESRLRTGGIRGFYVLSSVHDRKRFLHAKEAAAMVGISPFMDYIGPGRAGLCMVGQSASPIQVVWMMSHLFAGNNPHYGDPKAHVMSYILHLLREIHGAFLHRELPGQVDLCRDQGQQTTMMASSAETIRSWLHAEKKIADWGTSVTIKDELGVLPDHHLFQQSPLLGKYQLKSSMKKSASRPPMGPIRITLPSGIGAGGPVEIAAGTFLFQLYDSLTIERSLRLRYAEEEGCLDLDARLWKSGTLALAIADLQAAGSQVHHGLTDGCIDTVARRMMYAVQTDQHQWMPSTAATNLLHEPEAHPGLHHWLSVPIYAQLLTCVAVDQHWILLGLKSEGQVLQIDVWNGLPSFDETKLMSKLRKWGKAANMRPIIVNYNRWFPQTFKATCGTVALLHLGAILGLWTPEGTQIPDEWIWHQALTQRFARAGTLRAAGGKGQGKYADRELVWALRDILHGHGVPEDRTEERAHLAIQKIGAAKLQEAVDSRNAWAQLKALGSTPKVNFLWVKPDELDAQIKKKAQSKFKIQTSQKKQNPAGKFQFAAQDLDPSFLKIVPGTFVLEDGSTVSQIPIMDVQAHRAGIAFATTEDVLPYLKEEKSISLDGLAVLTTTRIPPHQQGLLPVTNLRIPAQVCPTDDPILIDGSLVNLGDRTISRARNDQTAEITELKTATLKLMLYKDETTIDWEQLKQAPLRTLLQRFPGFILCKGDRCGESCARYHAPVDVELDTVLLDVWSRTWMSLKGRKVSQEDADLFQVFVRVPEICAMLLQRLSATDGFYVEPRLSDGKGADTDTTVIWLHHHTQKEVLHKARTTEKAIAVTRFGSKCGIRVFSRDAETTHRQLCPTEPFSNFEVQKTWEMRPLPHGTQKTNIVAMLKAWGWQAKPLQPCRSEASGMGWLVGSTDDPPCCIMATSKGDVTITLHKKSAEGSKEPSIWTSTKTRAMLTKTVGGPNKGKQGTLTYDTNNPEADPWHRGEDPWSRFQPTQKSSASADVSMQATTMLESVESRLRNQLTSDPRMTQLETDVQEMRAQTTKFEGWFQEAGTQSRAMQTQLDGLSQHVVAQESAMSQLHRSMAQTEHRIEEVAGQVVANRSDVSALQSQITEGFQSMEALLSKRQRSE